MSASLLLGTIANSLRAIGGGSVKQGVSNVGGKALDTISSVNPNLGGQAGKAVDTVGKWTGNYFPETNASERAESAGGVNIAKTDPAKAQQMVADRSKQLGINPSSNTTNPSNDGGALNGRELTRDQASSMGLGRDLWNGQVVEVNGQKYRVEDTGRNTSRLVAINDSGGGEERLTQQDWSSALSGKEDFLSEGDLNALMDKYGSASRGNARALAEEIERIATENAEREYNTVKQALGVQREEVGRLGEQQGRRVQQEKELGLEELQDKETTETRNIEKQKASFIQERADTADTLASNWRDMSREVQRIMRARGVTDSSFSAGKETDVLLDFNKGLRTLAKQSVSAIQDFNEAVIETNKFYTRERNKLEIDATQQLEDIDTWVRQQVQSIQNQENMALTRKLNDIRSAIGQGNQLKIQVEQSIADKQFALDSWLYQTQVQYKQAVALAAQNKTGEAVSTIADYRKQAEQNYDLVTKGGYELQIIQDEAGNKQHVIHGKLPTGEDDYIYLTPGGASTLQQGLQNWQSGKPSDIEQLTQQYQTNTPKQSGGLLGSIKGLFQ